MQITQDWETPFSISFKTNVSDMVKITRELGQYVLLEDLANIKLFGSGKFTPADLRQFKKQLLIGDGYMYSSRDGLEKIKIVRAN